MNKRISTLFAASLLLSSVFGSVWAEQLKIGVQAKKVESGQTYHLVMTKGSDQYAYGFNGYSEENNLISSTYAKVAATTDANVDPEVYLWEVTEVSLKDVTGKDQYAYELKNVKTKQVLRFSSSFMTELSTTQTALDNSTTKVVFGNYLKYDSESEGATFDHNQWLYVAADMMQNPTSYVPLDMNGNMLQPSTTGTGYVFNLYKAAEEEVYDTELNKLYNSAGFNLKLDDKYKDIENIFDDSRIKAIHVSPAVTVEDGYSFPEGTYFAVSTPAGNYADADDQLAYLMDCEFIVVDPSLANNVSDSADEQKEGRGFMFTTATGRELNKYTVTNKDDIDPTKQAGNSEISVYNACFKVQKTATASGKYSIGLPNFRYEASAGTYAEKSNLILNIAEKKYGSETYLTTQTGTTAYIFTFVESNAVEATEFLNADGAAIYNIQFVSGEDDDKDELNKYLYAPAYAKKLYAKGAVLTDTNMPEFQFVITNVSGNNITFTNRANNNVKFTAKLFTEENGAYSLAIASNSQEVNKFDVLNVKENGDVECPAKNVNLDLKWVKLTTPESTDKFNGTWNVADESKVTISFARDNTPTSNKLYPVIEGTAFKAPTNDIADAAQWQLVKSEDPEYLTRTYAYLVGEGDDAEIKYMSKGDTTAYYTYNVQLIEDGEAVDKYLKNGSATLVTGNSKPTEYVIKDNVDGSVAIVAKYASNEALAFAAWNDEENDLDELMKDSNKQLTLSKFNTELTHANYIKTYLLSEAPEVSWPGEEGHVSIQSELGNYISMNEDHDGIVVNNEEEVYYLNVTDKDAVVPSFYISKGVGTADRMFLFNPADSVNYYVAAGQYDREYEWAKGMTKAIFKAGQLNETSDTLTTEIKGKVAKVAMKADNAGTQAGLNFFKFQIVETADGDGYYYIRQKNVGDKRYLANWSDKLTWESREKATLFHLEGVDAPTANEGVTATEVKVVAYDGAINIKNAAGKNVVVSTILGQIVANEVLTSDNATISVPAGIAIVSVDGEEAVKVSVR